LFDSPWYYLKYDVASSGLTPLSHFIQTTKQGIMNDPNEFFDTTWYLKQHNVGDTYPHPLFHYLEKALNLWINPSPAFDTQGYLQTYDDVDKNDLNPLEHYLRHGRFEGRNPLPVCVFYNEDRLALNEFRNSPQGSSIVFYTAIAGNYSRLLPPATLALGARYVCFSDLPRQTYGIWEIRPLPKKFEDSPRWAARWCKLHPHELFPEAEVAIWLDGNIIINGNLEKYIQLVLDGDSPMGMIRHPLRDCVYEEISACIERHKDNEDRLLRQKAHYLNIGLPGHNGLYETNVVINNLRHQDLPGFYELWWQELSEHSYRDQVSLPFVLHTLGIKPRSIMPEGISARNSNDFIFMTHENTFNVKIKDGLFPPEIKFPERPTSFAEYRRSHPACYAQLKAIRADVIVCVHNALCDVKTCFASLLSTLRPGDGLIIVNDASDVETTRWLRDFARSDPRVRLLENEQNLGYTGSANRGLRVSEAPFRVMLNSDTIVTRNWLEKLLFVAYCDDKTGIVGPLSNAASYQSIPYLEFTASNTPINNLPKGKIAKDIDTSCESWSPYGIYPSVPMVHGFCLGIRHEVINKIGFFDEINFANFFGEENDYCMRAADAGYIIRIATMVYVYHAKSKSISEATRKLHLGEASNKLQKIYGKKRIESAIFKLLHDPLLTYMRHTCSTYYDLCKIKGDRYLNGFVEAGFSVSVQDGLYKIENNRIMLSSKHTHIFSGAYEVYVKKSYGFFSNEEYIIYDIGFNLGYTSLYFACFDNVRHIYAFEPFFRTYQQGMENLAKNKKLAEKITVFNFGLGDKDEILQRAYNEEKPGSMSSLADRFDDKYEIEQITIKRADIILKQLFLSHTEKILLKIDCEGAESGIISILAENNLLKYIAAIMMEWHFSTPLYLNQLLSENGFFCFYSHQSHNTLGMIYAYSKSGQTR
jgi:FkbM family methyltransferase